MRKFHPPAGYFDGVIGGPPCQAFSRLRHLVEHNGYRVAPNLIPEFERIVNETRPHWFLMENVPDAPEPKTIRECKSIVVNNRWCGGEQNRLRRFSFGCSNPLATLKFHVPGEALEPAEWRPAVLASGGTRETPVRLGGSGKVKKTANLIGDKSRAYLARAYLARATRDQGLPEGFLEDAPFTVAGKIKVVGNGVPLPMGRAVARAVREALGLARVA